MTDPRRLVKPKIKTLFTVKPNAKRTVYLGFYMRAKQFFFLWTSDRTLNSKFEARNTKQILNPNYLMTKTRLITDDFRAFLLFPTFVFIVWNLFWVSDFEIRISGLSGIGDPRERSEHRATESAARND